MIQRQFISNTDPAASDIKRPPPLYAWIAIGALILFTVAGIATHAASILRPGYIVVSLAVAIFLYLRYTALYIGFTWWIWFITPLVSRLIDYYSGTFDESRLLLISQYLVTFVTMHTLIKDLPRFSRQGGLPFILAFIGVVYGFLIGLIQTSPITAARSILDWLVPIPFAFYLFVHWQDYPHYRQSIQRTFLWGVLVTGVYGIVQYLVAPEWDRFWLISTKISSFGDPEPLKIRLWSTMASPGPYAVMMMAGLLLLLTCRGPLTIPAAGAGYLSFLLTMVRTLWGCWLMGLLSMLTSMKPRLQMRLFVTILVMAICVVPLTTMEPFAEAINSRLESLTDLEQDNSAKVRKKIYEDGLTKAMTNYLGNGIGNTFIVDKDGKLMPIVIDSGFLETFFTLGWVGAILYLGGMIMLFFTVFQYSEFRFDAFMAACRAVALACFAALPGGSAMLSFSGMILWGFLAVVMAGHKYHQHQKTITFHQNIHQNIHPTRYP
ncbi:MAG: O-antigen ligase domain-containing protein [Scytonema sp. RU_4_4]|nr:O-antigen ligase domain-containing protein [Scytonema sp. RU_4_4]